jgi:SSS family solute:Na+ symporter
MYIQEMYFFFAPPFAAIFVAGILSRRVNALGATAALIAGFVLGLAAKIYFRNVAVGQAPAILEFLRPFALYAFVIWCLSLAFIFLFSLAGPPPRAEQIHSDLTFEFKGIHLREGLGGPWYISVAFWWGVFLFLILALFVVFSGLVFDPVV